MSSILKMESHASRLVTEEGVSWLRDRVPREVVAEAGLVSSLVTSIAMEDGMDDTGWVSEQDV